MFFSMLQNNIFVLFFPFPAAFPGLRRRPAARKGGGQRLFLRRAEVLLPGTCAEGAEDAPQGPGKGASAAPCSGRRLFCRKGGRKSRNLSRRTRRPFCPAEGGGHSFPAFSRPLSGGKAAFFRPRACGISLPPAKAQKKAGAARGHVLRLRKWGIKKRPSP